MAHSFWVICRNVSRTFVELCMETPYWCTVLVHQYGSLWTGSLFGKRVKKSPFPFPLLPIFFTPSSNREPVHRLQYGHRKSTETSGVHFFYKSFLFTRKLAYERIDISSNTWNGYAAENQKERLFFNETAFLFFTHCENSEDQIAVFSKWNMLREWKLVQRFTFCLSST